MRKRLPISRDTARQRGASAVEFAIITPVFLAGVIGVFYACLALFSYNALQNSLEIGARELLFEGVDNAQAEAAIRAAAASTMLDGDNLEVRITDGTTPLPHAEIVVTYDLRLLSRIGVMQDLTLSATKIVPREAPAP